MGNRENVVKWVRVGGWREIVSGGWRWVRVWGVQVRLGECGEGCRGVHGTGGSEGERGKSDLFKIGHVTFFPECARSHYKVQSIILMHKLVCVWMRTRA